MYAINGKVTLNVYNLGKLNANLCWYHYALSQQMSLTSDKCLSLQVEWFFLYIQTNFSLNYFLLTFVGTIIL